MAPKSKKQLRDEQSKKKRKAEIDQKQVGFVIFRDNNVQIKLN